MSHDLKHIQRLNGQWNYGLWSVLVKTVLQSKGVWSHVKGIIPEPIKESEERKSDFRIRRKEHEMDAAKALGILQQSLSSVTVMDARYLETAYDVWEHLEKKYKEQDCETDLPDLNASRAPAEIAVTQAREMDMSDVDHFTPSSSREAVEIELKHTVDIQYLSNRLESVTKELNQIVERHAEAQERIDRLDSRICAMVKKQESTESLN